MVGEKVDIVLISETKIDGTFPTSQFFMRGYSHVYRLDWNDKGGGIMLFAKNNLSTFPVSVFCFSEKTDVFRRIKPQETKMVEILVKDTLLQVKNAIDFYFKSYENIIPIGDFNAEISDSYMDSSCAIYHLFISYLKV